MEVLTGKREQLIINGSNYPTTDGTCIRDYIHVLDLASAHRLALEKVSSGINDLINLGTGQGYSVYEVASMARTLIGHLPMTFGPSREGDPAILVSDSHRAHVVLGWTPKHSSMENILKSTWRVYASKLK
jgi:UDP-glucose 4-epimerase